MEIQRIKTLKHVDDLTGMLRILTFLHKFRAASISTIINDLRLNQQPAYRTLNRLMDLGFIIVERFDTNLPSNPKKVYKLTDTGGDLAKIANSFYETYFGHMM